MAMVCPQCSKIFEQQERRCDSCNVQLLFYARFAGPGTPAAVAEQEAQWQQAPWGKILAGLVLAQGLAVGAQQLLTALFVAQTQERLASLWNTITGLAILHALHAAGLILGGIVSGAGQRRGMLYGALVGLASGFIFLFMHRHASALLTEGAAYAQPFAHMVIGAIGGLLGSFIWKPTPYFDLPEGKGSNIPLPPALEMRWLQGPIHWWRIAAGATLVVCGVIWSSMIMKWMLDFSPVQLEVSTHFQARLVTWEISGLAILVGALFAGATTYNGLKQGLCVGIGASVMFIGFQLNNPNYQLETTVLSIISMIALALVGGWFGGQLFPPLGFQKRRRKIADIG
jgi:hypothetical protein